MAVRNFTILSDLPKFTGDPRKDEAPFKSELDARTFLRSIENYCQINNITEDQKKIQILFSQIDKKRGNAIRLVTCYAGGNVTFEQVKKDILGMYPQLKVTEMREATKNFLKTTLDDRDMFCSMTSLEIAAKAVAEAYVKSDELTNGKFG